MTHDLCPIKTKRPDQAGFTITELVIVVLLVGIISTLILIAFGRNTEEERLKAAAKAMTQYLQTTLIYSRQTRQTCTVDIEHSTKIISIADVNSCDGRPTINLLNAVSNLSDLRICGSNNVSNILMPCDDNIDGSDTLGEEQSTRTRIIFTPRGSVSQGGLIKVYSPNAQRGRCVAITQPVGMIREGRDLKAGCNFTGE